MMNIFSKRFDVPVATFDVTVTTPVHVSAHIIPPVIPYPKYYPLSTDISPIPTNPYYLYPYPKVIYSKNFPSIYFQNLNNTVNI